MRNTLRLFAVLDLIGIAFLTKQSFDIVTHLNDVPNEFLSKAKVFLLLGLFVSLFISATGLLLIKKYGLITYYIQFPCRLLVWVFSIGFITYIPELFNLQGNWFPVLFKLCFVAEFFRMYFTVKIHRQYFR